MRARSRKADFFTAIRSQRLIAAVKEPAQVAQAEAAGLRVVFHLVGTIYDVVETVRRRSPGTLVFCHVDLIQGLAKDEVGMRLLAHDFGVDGILTTRRHLIKPAQDLGLVAILRLFLMDSEGLRTALEMARGVRADAVEILPAVAVPFVAHRLPFGELPPAISGGLVERPEQVEAILRTPVMAVSTSHQPLWTWRPRPEPAPALDA